MDVETAFWGRVVLSSGWLVSALVADWPAREGWKACRLQMTSRSAVATPHSPDGSVRSLWNDGKTDGPDRHREGSFPYSTLPGHTRWSGSGRCRSRQLPVHNKAKWQSDFVPLRPGIN